MSKLSTLRSEDFTGGLNLRADPFQLARNESPAMLNVELDPRGGFSSRRGVNRLNSTAVGSLGAGALTPRKLFAWAAASPQLLLAANDKVFYSTGGATWTDTTITTSFADGATFAPWATSTTSVVYVACGTGTSQMAKWNGSSSTTLTASATGQWQDSFASPTGTHMPRCNLTATHVDRLWAANTFENSSAYPNRIRWSHPLYPESWREIDWIDVPGGGSGITALVPYRDALLVFKPSAVYALYGYDTDTFQLVEVTTSLGALNSQSVVATEHGVYFFDWPRGLFRWDGRNIEDVFTRLRPLIQLSQLSSTNLAKTWVSHCNDKIWLSLPHGADTTPTYTYQLDYTIGAWTRHQLADGRGLACLTDFVDSTKNRLLVGCHPTQPYVLEVDKQGQWQDNLTGTLLDFESYYTTGWVDAGSVSSKKMWRNPDFVVVQPDISLTLTVDVFHNWEEAAPRRSYQLVIPANGEGLVWAASGTEPDGVDGWNEAVWGGGAEGSQFQRGQRLGLARAVQLKVSGPGGREWGVNSITYKFNTRRMR